MIDIDARLFFISPLSPHFANLLAIANVSIFHCLNSMKIARDLKSNPLKVLETYFGFEVIDDGV